MKTFEEKLATFLAKLEDALNDKFNKVSVRTQRNMNGGVVIQLICDNLMDIYEVYQTQSGVTFLRHYYGV